MLPEFVESCYHPLGNCTDVYYGKARERDGLNHFREISSITFRLLDEYAGLFPSVRKLIEPTPCDTPDKSDLLRADALKRREDFEGCLDVLGGRTVWAESGRWMLAVHRLAWSGYGGTRLPADKWAWLGSNRFQYDEETWSKYFAGQELQQPNSQDALGVEVIPDNPRWFSALRYNVLLSSALSIDLIINAVEAELERGRAVAIRAPLARIEVGQGEANEGRPHDTRDEAANTGVRLTDRQEIILSVVGKLTQDCPSPWRGKVIAEQARLTYDSRIRDDLSDLKKLGFLENEGAGYLRTDKPYPCP